MIAIPWTFALDLAPSTTAPAMTDAPLTEERVLVGAARSGSESAFRLLVDRYRDRVFGLALRIAGQREAAEEIAQDTFVRAWQALPQFRGDSRFSTWVYRIAYRRALDERAALDRRRSREPSLDPDDLDSRYSDGASPADWSTRLGLERLVRGLPEAQRVCVTLFYAADQSVEEIAKVLAVPSGTVKTHLFRARAALRERMAGRDAHAS